jgi:hypothetical protein
LAKTAHGSVGADHSTAPLAADFEEELGRNLAVLFGRA